MKRYAKSQNIDYPHPHPRPHILIHISFFSGCPEGNATDCPTARSSRWSNTHRCWSLWKWRVVATSAKALCGGSRLRASKSIWSRLAIIRPALLGMWLQASIDTWIYKFKELGENLEGPPIKIYFRFSFNLNDSLDTCLPLFFNSFRFHCLFIFYHFGFFFSYRMNL